MTDDAVQYESFGCASSKDFHTRPVSDQPPSPFPEAEIHNQITSVTIKMYADDIDDAFIHVYGFDPDRTAETFRTVALKVSNILLDVWS
jgi:propanediol dehydratase large subunit